jgi:hypothetical protein
MHVAPAWAGSGEESNHFGSYVRSLSLHSCHRLFPGLPFSNHSDQIILLYIQHFENFNLNFTENKLKTVPNFLRGII